MRVHDFDCDLALETQVGREVHRRHPAARNARAYLVAAVYETTHQRVGRACSHAPIVGWSDLGFAVNTALSGICRHAFMSPHLMALCLFASWAYLLAGHICWLDIFAGWADAS